jgi:hypothetical protein
MSDDARHPYFQGPQMPDAILGRQLKDGSSDLARFEAA